MKNTGKFIIEISSDIDYNNLIANILYEQELVAILSQENGIDELEIEILPKIDGKSWIFPLDEFVETLNLAKKRLCEGC